VSSQLDEESGAGFDLEDHGEHSTDDPEDLFTAPDIGPLVGTDLESSTAPVVSPGPQRKRDPRRLFISVGSLVLVLVTLGGWFLSDNWSRFFPNSQSAQDVPPPQRIDPIRRAKALHDEGKTAIAISQLRRLPPGDPHYTEAQALVAQWETAPVDSTPQGPTPGELERFRSLLANARSAQAVGENLLVVEFLTRAASIAPLDDIALADLANAETSLLDLRDQIQVFRSGDWEYALPALWRMREANSSNADINRLIIDSYYNLGVRDLQRGRPESAAHKFEEALNLRPTDKILIRLRAFSETYQERPEDLLYRIFVKYLPFR
jgi:tetratricopeptide (TPR) repeat protein